MNEALTFTLAVLSSPMHDAEAMVVLCGEDALPRLGAARWLAQHTRPPHIVLSGGRHEPDRWIGAEHAAQMLGIEHATVDVASMNTREQAVNVVDMAVKKGWLSLALVASSYHLPRAFLTFLQALKEQGCEHTIRLVPAPAAGAWFAAPLGMQETRAELLEIEGDKILLYGEKGHTASYSEGIDYLRFWEGR